jgi:hypothetical protein
MPDADRYMPGADVIHGRRRRRIVRMVDRLVETPDWNRTQALLGRYPELVSEAAKDRLVQLAEFADREEDREAAEVYWFHRS